MNPLDDELVDTDPAIRPLLEKFVCVRQVATNGLDLRLFQFDTDQSFAVFMLNADGTIYGRFGTRSHRMIIRHVFPNVLSPIMVSATLGVAQAIITESALSYLGRGFPWDFPTWGQLLFDGVPFLNINSERMVWPGLAISLTELSVIYMGDGLRDALDPRIRGR